MGLKLGELNTQNYQSNCFLSVGSRENSKFLDHGDTGYRQEFRLGEKDWDLSLKKNNPRSISTQDVQYYAQRKEVIKDKKSQILNHVDMRIALFFEQAILCHKTPFMFSAEGAEDQIGVGTKLMKNKKVVHQTQAAHPSTLPCLHASFKDNPQHSFIFLKHSLSYQRHNSTNELPIEVNQTDTLIDGKQTDAKLRSAALKILNDDAEGKIDPTKATKRFLKALQGGLERQLSALNKEDVRREVVEIYLERVKKVREDAKDSSEIFDLFMGMSLADDQVLRNVVYKRRFSVLKEAAFVESKIAKKIFDAEKKMMGTTVRSLKNVATPLRYVLIEGGASQKERLFFEKFFCTSLDQLNSHFENKEAKLRKARNEIEKLKTQQVQSIKTLRKEIATLREELEYLEVEFRAQLFKGLREEFKDWTQLKFAQTFHELYPHDKMSQPMVSRIEFFARAPKKKFYETPECQRKKEMSLSYAQRIATTFGIDVGLFLPGLLSSNY